MKKTIVVLLMLLFYQCLIAQDSIVKYNGDVIPCKVTEVSTTEIRYKQFDFLDGPVYVVLKYEVRRIKYSTGKIEEFQRQKSSSTDSKVRQDDNDYVEVKSVSSNKIQLRGKRFVSDGRVFSERGLYYMLLETKDPRIAELVRRAKADRILQYVGYAGIPAGILGLNFWLSASLANSGYYSGSYYSSYGSGPGAPAGTPNASVYSALGTTCFVIAVACPIGTIIFRNNRKRYNLEAIGIFNEKYAR